MLVARTEDTYGGGEGKQVMGEERGPEKRGRGLLEVQEMGEWGREWNGRERTLEKNRTKQVCEP